MTKAGELAPKLGLWPAVVKTAPAKPKQATKPALPVPGKALVLTSRLFLARLPSSRTRPRMPGRHGRKASLQIRRRTLLASGARSVRGWSVDVPDGCSRSSAGKRLAEVVGTCRDDVGLHRPMRQAPIPVTVGPTADVRPQTEVTDPVEDT